MKNKPLDFQTATAEHVLEAYKRGQKRVLVADEAGLGKTTVASEVVRRVKDELHEQVVGDDGLYCIVYVCCNLQIAQQNIDTLSDDGAKVDLSQSRLSMQHYVYYRKKADLQKEGKDTLVLSLTPATSFQMTWGTGSANERALMYACLSLLPEFEDGVMKEKLSAVFVGWAPKSWDWVSTSYYDAVRAEDMAEYRETIIEALNEKLCVVKDDGQTLHEKLIHLCNTEQDKQWQDGCNRLTIKLRKVFADISLETLKPDLVIMDEFQKFSSLISTDDDSEENMIARKFFDNKDTYILLLSATPYKPYTTLEELNESNSDEQYEDFHRLMDFLYTNNAAEIDFKNVWREYSATLKHLDINRVSTFKDKHDTAEKMLYHVMGRTERSNEGIIKDIKPQNADFLSISNFLSVGDIESFIQMQHLVDNCRKHGKNIYSAPVDYTKSSSFQLSFMDNYKLKDKISEAWKSGAGKGVKKDCLLLDEQTIKSYSLSDYRNAKVAFVVETIFGKDTGKESTGVEQLLWVPASHPYYTQKDNVFSRNAAFSKYLAFSSWGMVPKMLACLLSYEAERRLYRRAYYDVTYSDEEKSLSGDSDKKQILLKDTKKTKSESVMTTASAYLSELYHPEEWYGKPLSAIKQNIRAAIKQRLKTIDAKTVKRVSSVDVYQLLKVLDDSAAEVRNMPPNAEEILADMAIGAPANCLYRIFTRLGDTSAKTHAEEVAKVMIGVFNNRYGIAAVRCNCRAHNNYFQNVVDYCIMGNLQAVFDEFVHMIGETKAPEKIAERIKESFADVYTQPVNTLQSFGTTDKMTKRMRKHFAVDFGSGKQTEKDVNHATKVRSAFNSPFRPFVLASTSVGQEGLDFHWYCRKMIHWNLPSNPQNLEQREGRINRYKCLSVRRNVAKLYKDVFSWNEIFLKAKEELKNENSEMVPFWFLPLNDERFKNVEKEFIERIVPMYPMSEDVSKYDRLIKVLSLYRLTMGQPRQEELLQLLEGKLSEQQTRELLFDLSPFSRNKKNKK